MVSHNLFIFVNVPFLIQGWRSCAFHFLSYVMTHIVQVIIFYFDYNSSLIDNFFWWVFAVNIIFSVYCISYNKHFYVHVSLVSQMLSFHNSSMHLVQLVLPWKARSLFTSCPPDIPHEPITHPANRQLRGNTPFSLDPTSECAHLAFRECSLPNKGYRTIHNLDYSLVLYYNNIPLLISQDRCQHICSLPLICEISYVCNEKKLKLR